MGPNTNIGPIEHGHSADQSPGGGNSSGLDMNAPRAQPCHGAACLPLGPDESPPRTPRQNRLQPRAMGGRADLDRSETPTRRLDALKVGPIIHVPDAVRISGEK